MSENQITEAQNTDSRLGLVRKLLASAEEKSAYVSKTDVDMAASTREGMEREIEALTVRAAELMAKYGIDRAMLAASGAEKDAITDKIIWVPSPYSEQFRNLLSYITTTMRGEARWIKQHTGAYKVGQAKWKYGIRIFAFSSDLLRIELMYASIRNQALAGASRIRGSAEYGQDQRAYRINYLEGFSTAIYARLAAAEREAQEAAEAEKTEADDQALLEGRSAGASVELVLSDRKTALARAVDLANGITPEKRAQLNAGAAENRARWDEMDRKARERYDAHVASHATCERCHNAASGFCQEHRDLKPVQGRAYRPSVGEGYRYTGYSDGQKATLGAQPGHEVGGSRTALQ